MWRFHDELWSNKIGELLVEDRIYLSTKPHIQEIFLSVPYGVRAVYVVDANGRRFLVIPLDQGDIDDPSLLFKEPEEKACRK